MLSKLGIEQPGLRCHDYVLEVSPRMTFHAEFEHEVKAARDALAARITCKDGMSLEGSDVIRLGRNEQQVRLFFREQHGQIRMVVTNTAGRRDFGPVIEVSVGSSEFHSVLALALDKVGAKLKKS